MINATSELAPAAITAADVPNSQLEWIDRYRTWQRFHSGVRKPGMPFLKNLSHYPQSVLVAGCQRSGTTMLTRLIAASPGFSRLALTRDDELDAALALAGIIDLPRERRYCFQTTYLNERCREYQLLGPQHRLIWVLRNPFSVVYSMLHNWQRFGLNELYEGCGIDDASPARMRRTALPWPLGPSQIEKACLAYRGKVAQTLALRDLVQPGQLLIIDYDALVAAPDTLLPRIFAFVGAPYEASFAKGIRRDSVKKADRLSRRSRGLIETLALPTYRQSVAAASSDFAG
jgi:hypothetical protein